MDIGNEFEPEKSFFKDSTVAEDDVIPLVSSLIGVSEFAMTKIVDDVQMKNEEQEPILKSQMAKKRNSLDCFIIKTLINIQIENGTHKVLCLEDYQRKLKENVSIDFPSDQIKKWLNVIGLKWTEESKELEENTENQSSTEEFTLKCSAEVKTEEEDNEFIETDDFFIEDVKLECTEEEDLSFALEDDEMTNEEIKPSTKNSELIIPKIEMEEETQNINVQLEMEENNKIDIKTELFDIEDEVQPDLVNIEEFNQTINTENCIDETNVPYVYLAPPPIHPLAEKIITDIGIHCGSKGEIPYFHYILEQVQVYDKNINNETLEVWLKVLKITYRHNNRIARTHNYLPTHPTQETFPTLDYFHQNMNKTRYKCSKGTLMKWLQLLQIDFKPYHCESGVKKPGDKDKDKDKLSSPVITHLIQLEKDFYKKGLPIKFKKNKSTKDKDTQLIPTLDHFYYCLKQTNEICCKWWLKKWLQFLNITFVSTNCDLGKRCESTEEPPSPSVIKLLIHFEETAFDKPKTTEPGVLVGMLEDLDRKFKNINVIPTLDFIYLYYINTKSFKRHYSKKRLMDWLTVLKINFKNEIDFDKKLDKITSVPVCDKDSLPTLEYFYNKINECDCVCSKITLMKWLEMLTIKYELKGSNLETDREHPDQPLSSGIMNSLINLEDDFYKSKENSLVLPRFLVDLETQFKKENRVPSLNDFQQKVVNSKIFQSYQACSKNNIKSLLTRLNIYFIVETSFNVSPALSYFREKLKNKRICVSLSQLNVWLNDVGIAFENDLKNLVKEKAIIRPISDELRQLLCDIDHEYRLKDLITHLKNVEKDYDKHRKCLTFENIYEIIKTTNLFNTDVSTDYKKLSLKKWVRKLGIKFADKKEQVPSLDYFHEKIKIIEGITVSKDLLAKWLNQIGVEFKENHLITDNPDEPPAPAKIIPTLRQISKYHCLWDVEPIFKKIEKKFLSRQQVPSIDYLEKILFELKGKHYCKKVILKNWLTFVGITFRTKRTIESQEIEKDIDSILKKKSKSKTRHYEETQTVNTQNQEELESKMDVVEIDNDDDESMDLNIESVELPQQTEVIEVEDDDSEDMPKKKKRKSSLSVLETASTSKEPKPSTSKTKKPKPSTSKKSKSPKRQFVSKKTESPKNTSSPGHVDDDDDDEIVEIPQQTEVIEIVDDDSEDVPKKKKCKSPLLVPETPSTSKETKSSKHQVVSEKTESPKIISEPSSSEILHSYERLSAPDELMRVLTDFEYNYFRMKQIPTLENFYCGVVKNFGNLYSKDVLKKLLIKTRIKFTSSS